MKTLIAIPCMDNVAAGFAQSLASLRKVGDCAVSFMVGSLIYDSRNKLAKQAVEMEADYILWLDSDVIFNPDLMERLYALDADIATGLYFRRTAPFTPVIFKTLEKEDGHLINEGYEDYPEDPFEVAGCGFGAVLMKADVLFNMPDPGMWFTPAYNAGEDIAFCMRAREAGYKIVCDPKAQLGHVGHVTITENFYKQVKQNGKNNS